MAQPIARIRRADGAVQFDAGTMTFQLLGKGTVAIGARRVGNTSPGSAFVPKPSGSATQIIAVRSAVALARAGTFTEGGQTFEAYAAAANSGAIDYWVFGEARQLQPSPVGLTLRTRDGVVTYSSDFDVLRVIGLMSGVGSAQSFPAGRLYAAAAQTFAGHRLDTGGRVANGQEVVVGEGDGGYDSNTYWQYRNDGKLYGARFDGTTCHTEAVSYDDVLAELGFGSSPPPAPPDWQVNLDNLMIVDVTGL